MSFYISDISYWKPSLEDLKEVPKLEWADPLFKRRLSQITKMTVQVLHDLIEKNHSAKSFPLVFVSLRGEIKREFTINEMLIKEKSILPASFSLSVFNAPIAAATLALSLKGGYSVIFPSKNNFKDAFKIAVSPVLAKTEEDVVFVYADELVPDEYGDLRPAENLPMAFAFTISGKNKNNSIQMDNSDLDDISKSPSEFFNFLTM